ncbi:MAG: hypothetical protein U1E17_07825 [Geminicoccaceae bacterium]
MAEHPLILVRRPNRRRRSPRGRAARPDAIIATGRSDYPNQVNNVLCFPFIFRAPRRRYHDQGGDEARLRRGPGVARARAGTGPVAAAYGLEDLSRCRLSRSWGAVDPRLIIELPAAVAEAAMATGVAIRCSPTSTSTARRSRSG